jgi:hypothetical protein
MAWCAWAARYNTWLFIKLTLKGVVVTPLFLWRVAMQIRKKLRSLEGLLQFRGNEQEISHTAHKLSVGAFALQSALDKVRVLPNQM